MGSYLMLFIRNLGNTAYFVEFFSFTVVQNGIFATNKFHNSQLCRQLKGRAGCEIIDTNLGYLDRNTLIIDNADFVVCSDYGNGTIDGIEKAVSSGKKVYVLGKYASSSRVKKKLTESELVLIHNV